MAETGRMVSLQEQTHAIANHPLFMGHGEWPVGLQPLGGLTFLFPSTQFTGIGVETEDLLDLISTEEGLFLVNADTGEPIGCDVSGMKANYKGGWRWLMVL